MAKEFSSLQIVLAKIRRNATNTSAALQWAKDGANPTADRSVIEGYDAARKDAATGKPLTRAQQELLTRTSFDEDF